jgi:hypothetical protein
LSDPHSPLIRLATRDDLASIQAIYANARRAQLARGQEGWPAFSDASVLDEIDHRRLLCLIEGREIAGVFSIAYDDAALWGDRERGEHVYLHRIAKSARARIGDLLEIVLTWARMHCRELGRTGLRMDTWASNAPLIALYERRGFRVVDRVHVADEPRLPPQYQQNDFVLLEEVESPSENPSSPPRRAR